MTRRPRAPRQSSAPDLRFLYRGVAVQTSGLQRDRGLGGEQLQDRDPCWREDAGR
jgi:hypothetical protein